MFLACPNNPTGNRFSDAAMRKILENVDAAVVIDEAYFSFSAKTFLPYLNKHRNMIILRTLSKIGLAGLRIGVLTASK
ncbi:MAG: aminotransferase class I/II-fold pyridoxal phosphate-dependent enzyme, partial [Nitrospirae bacterium]|nr:aminotransferase class I/II-fold pyridoxal phosphate-dependent enzyme [Nitrospirota bacterium]